MGVILGKRGIDVKALPDYLSEAKKGSIFVNTECMSFNEILGNLKGKKKKKYLDIIAWKRERGVEIDSESLKFEKKWIEEEKLEKKILGKRDKKIEIEGITNAINDNDEVITEKNLQNEFPQLGERENKKIKEE